MGGYVRSHVVLRDGRGPVTDAEPFAGALAHFVFVQGDGESILHVHGGSDAFGHFQNFRDPPGYGGPKLYLTPPFGDADTYRIFAHFQRGQTRYTVPFDVEVVLPGPGER